MSTQVSNRKKGRFEKFIDWVEVVGNKIPHPFWMFIGLSFIILFLSYALAKGGVSIAYITASRNAADVPTETTISAINLLSREQLTVLFSDFVSNYTGFAPLGLVMVMMLGIGLLDKSGMLESLMRVTILGAPVTVVTAAIALAGVNANLASDAGIVVVATLGGAIFKAIGRKPWVGVIAGYAAANGGFGANMLIAGTDALLAGITGSVSQGIEAPIHPLMNWFYMFAASFFIIGATVFVTERFTAKRLNDTFKFKSKNKDDKILNEETVSPLEKKALKRAGIVFLIFIFVILALTLPADAFFRNSNGKILPKSPLMSSIIFLLFLMFFSVGIAYGKVAGSIKNMNDIPKMMSQGVADALGFIVVALPASVFIHLLYASKITTMLAVAGGKFLQNIQFTGFPLMVVFIIITALINIFVTSGSAKWLILAPIFVPMFSQIGWSPALTQIAYRIADSCTNILSPIGYYLPVIIGILETYRSEEDEDVGIGTVLSLSLPYSIAYFVVLVFLLFIWVVFKLPLGPGVEMFLN